jgi:hypothetical protein
MRHRIGKGQVVAFDAALEKKLEEMKKARGYYPTLKDVAESFTPAHTVTFIFRSLRRLSEAGRLSDEANRVYDSKNKKGENSEKGKDLLWENTVRKEIGRSKTAHVERKVKK